MSHASFQPAQAASARDLTGRIGPAGVSWARLQGYLLGDGPCVPVDCQALGAHAQALLLASEGPLPGWPWLEAPVGPLAPRVNWFHRLLCLLPDPERERWMQQQLVLAEAHPMAGSALRHRLDPLLFDTRLALPVRCRLWAIWLGTAGPGPIVLDPGMRDAQALEAEQLVEQALLLQGS